MSAIATYFRERFQLPAVATLAIGVAIWLVSISKTGSATWLAPSQIALIALGFVAFLLRQRSMDEFKDRGHDAANYPNRPMQRGAILPRTVVSLGVFAFAIEIACVVGLAAITGHWLSIAFYLGVLGFSALTFVEFFAAEWLNRHFTVYFVSHQLIFVLFALWAQNLFSELATLPAALGCAAFVLAMAALEVMRKFEIRTNAAGEVVADTYLAVWGRKRSVAFVAIAFALSGILLAAAKIADAPTFALNTASLMTGLAGLGAAAGVALVAKSNRAVQGAIIIGFFVLGLVSFFS